MLEKNILVPPEFTYKLPTINANHRRHLDIFLEGNCKICILFDIQIIFLVSLKIIRL